MNNLTVIVPLIQKQINNTGFIHVVDVLPRIIPDNSPSSDHIEINNN